MSDMNDRSRLGELVRRVTPALLWKSPRPLNETHLRYLLWTLSITYWIGITLYAMFPANIPRPQFAIAFIGCSIVLYLSVELHEFAKEGELHWGHLLSFTAIAIATTMVSSYVWLFYEELRLDRIGFYYSHEYILAAVILAIIGYLVYREYGYTFISVYLFTFFYAYYGYLFPSWLGHAGFTTERILGAAVLNLGGLYGNLTVVVGTWIAPFLLFSGLVQAFGAFDLIIRASLKVSEYIKSGVAQSAVVASMAIGSINGTSVANTAISGSITIPLMKKHGVKGKTAGAIESVASSGGQIMPPIMGASAFLMANLLQIPYSDILVAAVIPAIIFYIIVALNVHLIVVRHIEAFQEGIDDIDEEVTPEFETKSRFELALESMQFAIPLVFLVYLLAVVRYSIMYTAFMTVGVTVLTTAAFQIGFLDRSLAGVKGYLTDLVEGGRLGAMIAGPIAIIVATIAVIIQLLLGTGVPNSLALSLMDISGGTLLGVAVMAFIISLILGMGMPSVGAYLIVALIVAPGIIRNFAISELATHFFVFYAALLSALTPPIAMAVIVACGIANSNFWRTCLEAIRIGFPMFILPFIFIYQPIIVADAMSIDRVLTSFSIFTGMVVLSIAFNAGFFSSLGRSGAGAERSRFSRLAINGGTRAILVAIGFGILFITHVYTRYTIIAVVVAAGILFAIYGDRIRSEPSP